MGEVSLMRRLKESAMHGRRRRGRGQAEGGEGGSGRRHDELICHDGWSRVARSKSTALESTFVK